MVQMLQATPPAPASIDNDEDIQLAEKVTASSLTVLKNRDIISQFDGVVVACFSVGTMPAMLSTSFNRPAIGIFEASILTALSLVEDDEKWGIVTTGAFWEQHLTAGVYQFLGQNEKAGNDKFSGVFTSGLNAGDFHKLPPAEVDKKLFEAAENLFKSGNVKVAVMGCAGMVGLEPIIRRAAVEVYGADKGWSVFIVDAVQAGVGQLYEKIQSRKKFREARR